MVHTAIAILAVLVATGCQRGSEAERTTVPTQPENLSGALERNMENCPSYVTAAETTVENVDGGVILTIVGDKETEGDIRVRARHQAKIEPRPRQPLRHSGQGTGGGAIGYCPIVHPGTSVTVEDVRGGARVTIIARDEAQVDELRRVVSRRVAAVRQRKEAAAER